MASSDGRLLRWIPGPPTEPEGPNLAKPVENAPIGNRTFVVTAERHVILFAMDGVTNQFGWCSQEDIEDWDYSDLTSSASFYEIEPAAPFLAAQATRFGVLAFTVVGTYFAGVLPVLAINIRRFKREV